MEQRVGARLQLVSGRRQRLGRTLAPYGLLLPGGFWLALFFVLPMLFMASVALQTGNIFDGFRLTWHVQNFSNAISLYHTQYLRSIWYASLATGFTLVVSYPLAYWIAFHGGRRKTTFLLLLLLPFFVSFVIRTLAWQWILSDNGIVLGTLKDWHLVPQSFHVLATSTAVVAGIAYNFLPFMALPVYVSLERIDRSVVEAAQDLYASKAQAFLRVILPLSIPGIFAGVLLTFVPALGDYVNASILGGPGTTMVGNIIQLKYLQDFQYPIAGALSFLLMAAALVLILVYARVLGTRSIEDYV
ncbi:MAG: ABC transporter permease [Actinomycetota bacterium]